MGKGSNLEQKMAEVTAEVDAVRDRVQAAYDKMMETHDRKDVAAYREVQAEYLAIPRHIREPAIPRGPGDAVVVLGGEGSKNGDDV